MSVNELILENAIKEAGDVCDVRLDKAFAEDLLEILREHNNVHSCLKAKCCICPHCRDCDVDDKGKIKGKQDAAPLYEDRINVCPKCGNTLNRYYHPDSCGHCGQKLIWY